jgi:hypothetical protein
MSAVELDGAGVHLGVHVGGSVVGVTNGGEVCGTGPGGDGDVPPLGRSATAATTTPSAVRITPIFVQRPSTGGPVLPLDDLRCCQTGT